MKITIEDYTELKTLINSINKDVIAIHRAAINNNPNIKDKELRLIWDLLWAIPSEHRTIIMVRLYKYCNDSHISSALRKIAKELGL